MFLCTFENAVAQIYFLFFLFCFFISGLICTAMPQIMFRSSMNRETLVFVSTYMAVSGVAFLMLTKENCSPPLWNPGSPHTSGEKTKLLVCSEFLFRMMKNAINSVSNSTRHGTLYKLKLFRQAFPLTTTG